MKKKILTALALTLCAVVLVVASVLGTIAYLSASVTVSNTFTIGNIAIHLHESVVNDQGVALPENPSINGTMKDSDGNTYHLIPGHNYCKDPTVYVVPGSESAYLFVYVQNGIEAIEEGNFHESGHGDYDDINDTLAPTIHEQMVANGWYRYKTGTKGVVYYYSVKDSEGKATSAPLTVAGGDTTLELPVFQEFTLDKHADSVLSAYANAEVNITAFAIQSVGFNDDATTADKNEAIDAAWEAIMEAYPAKTDLPNA